MPLVKSPSKKALSQNIATEVRAGRDPKQAAAIGFSEQRRARGLGKRARAAARSYK